MSVTMPDVWNTFMVHFELFWLFYMEPERQFIIVVLVYDVVLNSKRTV